jgi:hypothetical protein
MREEYADSKKWRLPNFCSIEVTEMTPTAAIDTGGF